MAIFTIKINELTKAGKTLQDLLELFSKQSGVEIIEEKSPYNPEFVKMVKKAAASKNRTRIDPVNV
jgi:hypothetical protein